MVEESSTADGSLAIFYEREDGTVQKVRYAFEDGWIRMPQDPEVEAFVAARKAAIALEDEIAAEVDESNPVAGDDVDSCCDALLECKHEAACWDREPVPLQVTKGVDPFRSSEEDCKP